MNFKKMSERRDKNFIEKVGGKITPNSGGTTFYKGDGITDVLFMEGKSKENPVNSVSISKADIIKARQQAFDMGKDCWVLRNDFGPAQKDGKMLEIVSMESKDFIVLYDDMNRYKKLLKNISEETGPNLVTLLARIKEVL